MKNARIWFSKTHEAKYISHLDLNRCMLHAIIGSQVKIWYTEGFNPHPSINFALPLPLGINGMNESMDLKLLEDNSDNKNIIKSLNNYLPNGIKIFDITDQNMKSKEISYALFSIVLKKELKEKLEEFFDLTEIITTKKTKKKLKEINLKEHIIDYYFEIKDNNLILYLTLPAGNNLNINPFLFFNSFNKYFNLDLTPKLSRLQLFNSENKAWN